MLSVRNQIAFVSTNRTKVGSAKSVLSRTNNVLKPLAVISLPFVEWTVRNFFFD
jgi:hypothetical protein